MKNQTLPIIMPLKFAAQQRHNIELAVITVNSLSGCSGEFMIFNERFTA